MRGLQLPSLHSPLPGQAIAEVRKCCISVRPLGQPSCWANPWSAGKPAFRLGPGACTQTRASRDPDRVSILEADGKVDASSAAGTATASSQRQQQTADGDPATSASADACAGPRQPAAAAVDAAVAADAPSTTASSSSSSTSQRHLHHHQHHSKHDFGVTAAQLRQLVQAGVDDSQLERAGSIINHLTVQQLQRQQHKQHKGDPQKSAESVNKSGSSSSLGSVASSESASTSIKASGNGAPPARSSMNGTAVAAASNGTSAAASASVDAGLVLLPRALASALGSSLSSGLSGSASDVAARVAAFGSNSLAAASTSSFWQLLLEAASDSTLLLLMAAGAVSLGLAASTGKEAVDFIDGAAILASVAICVTVTAVTNYQKEAKFRQLNSLKENIPVRVVRAGVEITLSCFDLLVGDVLLVEAGDILPADGLLFAGGQLKVDESHLTGESDDVVKEPPSEAAASAAAAGTNSSSSSLSSCLCMSGSKVLEGFGRMLVLAVGPNSQQGMIQQMVLSGGQQPPDEPAAAAAAAAPAAAGSGSSMLREATPLMSRLEEVANSIGGVGLTAAGGVLAVNSGLYTAELLSAGASPWTSESIEAYLSFFITSMTLLVVAVPEGLPLAVTLALAFSVQRMLTDNNLVRNLSSCETMAAATAICSDKTGTLTENNMAVVKLIIGGTTFNVRPSATAAAGAVQVSNRLPSNDSTATLAAATTAAAASSSSSSFVSASSTRTPTLRSTSSIAASSTTPTSTSSEEEQDEPRSAGLARMQQAVTQYSNGSSGSSGTSSLDAASWPPARLAAEGSRAPGPRTSLADASTVQLAPDVLTMVSLSLDGDALDLEQPPAAAAAVVAAVAAAAQRQQQQQQLQPPGVQDAGSDGDVFIRGNGSNSDNELLTSTSSMLGSTSSSTSRLPPVLRELLSDSISLNSTASIRVVEAPGSTAADNNTTSSSSPNSATALCSVSTRQLDRSGNRTECALLEFGGRLEGRLLPGSGSVEQQRRVLQVFPFSSTRKRMSSLVATGPPISAPGSGQVGQPARLYVKGAAELLLDKCRLQVGVDGSLLPLSSDQVKAAKARCGRGGLRVLALAYKDMLLQPADAAEGPSSSSSSGGGADSGASPSGRWQLLAGDEDQRDLVLIGLLALEDPVRVEVPGAIKDCQRAGIAVRMITGDNAATAAAIAASCGILPPQLAQQVEDTRQEAAATSSTSSSHHHQQQQIAELRQLLGQLNPPSRPSSRQQQRQGQGGAAGGSSSSSWLDGWLHGLSGVSGGADPDAGLALCNSVAPDPRLAVLEGPVFRALVLNADGSTNLDAFAALWPHLRVMARCTPADKFTLVQAVKALRARGQLMETIAVTGDGTNDAPALNAADVGFAMAAGTSIAKDASDILLLDNNFRSIVSAVKWGRNVYSSVTKFLQFQLTANVVALVTAAGGALALRSSPLSAVQMLWVNLIMDSLASLALATEAPTDAMLDEPPRVRDGPIITPTVAKSILGQAALQLGVLAALLGPLGDSITHLGEAAADATAAAAAASTATAAAMMAAGGVDAAGVGERMEQYTLVFNSFVLMQLFNQVNSRKIHDEPNVLEGLSQQKLFLLILGLEAGLQVAIVQAGGRAFSTVPLNGPQWAVCVGFGALTLLLRQLLRLVPTEPPSGTPPHGPGSGSSSKQQTWQQATKDAAAAAAFTAAAAVGAVVLGPVQLGMRSLRQALSRVGGGGAATQQQQQHGQQGLARQRRRLQRHSH